MIGSFLTRVSIMILGYAYPAYECYKVVEKNKPEIEHLRFWCQYWIIVALLTIFERFGDAFISWLPMYGEVKLAFFVYLWHPKIKGTTYIYETYLQSYMSRHEREIDHNLLELRTNAADFALFYWQKAFKNCRSWFYDVALCVLLQSSTTRLCPVQAEHAPAAFPTENEQAENTQHSEPLKTEPTKQSTRKKAGLAKAGSPRSPAIASSKSGQGPSPADCSHACLPTLHEDARVDEEDVTVDENDSSLRHKETRCDERIRTTRLRTRKQTAAAGTSSLKS
ncbi:hypothetical protein HPP92_006896 [Vanilla planifolia]|uniref:HVA22-like protein n=1 Tax=Vanilla planifolia TaxID=51239 RepID=A0A835RLB5_VANPL|nr:hypothetical protein HPP92_007139 [Vanilla planifolia]KAG0490033.1 hypothetical protein HPP92_006896 [Vanilla planifolia]